MPDGNLSPSATIFTSNLESLSIISAASILAREYGAANNEHKDTTKRNRDVRDLSLLNFKSIQSALG